MDKDTFDYVAQRANILATADSSKQETKDAARAWLKAVAEDNSDAAVEKATETFVNYLDGRPRTIDGLIEFLEGPAKELFGEEKAAAGLAVQKKRKAEGAKFCDCPSCTAASEILAKFGRVEL
ncbi:MAG: 3-hydroxyisobutyrate dehydrogenase [Eggerthellaceae bacterium]